MVGLYLQGRGNGGIILTGERQWWDYTDRGEAMVGLY